MDPLSLSASITALLQLTSSVIQYLNGVRGASEDRGRILSESASVNSILFILQDQADQANGDQWAVNSQAGRSRRSALQLASRNGHQNVVKMLLNQGADVNGCNDKIWGSALQYASKRGHKNIVKMLVSKGAVIPKEGTKTPGREGEFDPLAKSNGPDPEAIAAPPAHDTTSPSS